MSITNVGPGYQATVLDAFIGSPGDVPDERYAVEEAIREWNGARSVDAKTILRPRRWEPDSVPLLGGQPGQGVINKQLLYESHIVIVIFHARLGTPTRQAVSGTAEELEISMKSGKPTHVYFSTKDLPHDVDQQQLRALRSFRRRIANLGLIAEFSSTADLRAQVYRALEYDVSSIMQQKPV